MKKNICLTKIWSDDDLFELRVDVSDGNSLFVTTTYVGQGALQEIARSLAVFRNHIHGGVTDIRLGEFGPEYANGAFHARLHFRDPGRLYISTHQQSDHTPFSAREVASEAKMYFTSEPILLDTFIAEMHRLASGVGNEANLAGA